MKEINGQFIMDGCAPDDPNRLDTAEQLVALLRAVGFLPLFSNAIPGFSVEGRVPADRWWTDEESDPWAWRHMLADHPEIAYGKFFFSIIKPLCDIASNPQNKERSQKHAKT